MNEPMMMLSRDANGSTHRRFAETLPARTDEDLTRPSALGRLGRLWSSPRPEPVR